MAGSSAFHLPLAARRLTALVAVFWLISTTGCSWLDARQRNILYRPTLGVSSDFKGLREGDERYFVSLSAPITPASAMDTPKISSASNSPHRVEMWWLPHADKNAPTLLYYHGTFRNLFQNLHKIDALRQAGFAVLAVEYRGWGVSTPITPSEQSIMQDADLAWTELKRREPRTAQRVIYGHSMGSGVAVDVASRLQAQTDYGALILESALTSFRDVAYEAGFLARILAAFNSEQFASIDKISRVTAPVLMIHGSLDTTIPIRIGEKLFAAANSPKEWLPIEGAAHSNSHQVGGMQYQTTLEKFKKTYLLSP